MRRASGAGGKTRRDLLEEAARRAAEANAIEAHTGDYILACVRSMQGLPLSLPLLDRLEIITGVEALPDGCVKRRGLFPEGFEV